MGHDLRRRLTHVESAPLAATIESTKTCGSQQGAALMKRTTKYVAFDVHQATTVASVREESGRVIARSVLPTDSGALTEFVRGMRGARHVTFEEGTQAQWLYELLAPLVDRVIVCDRRGAPRQGNKGDQVDADHLSELLRRGALRAVYHGSADRATLKELTRTYRNLVEDATRVMLRLKALFRARGIPTAGTAVYHPRHRARWLAQLLEGGARCRAGRGVPLQCRLHARRRRARAAAARPDDPWAESEPQSRAQGCLQRCGDGRHSAARPAAGFLPRRDGARHAGGTGALDTHPQARGPHAPALEKRRALRSDQADDASALAPVPRRGGGRLRGGSFRYRDRGAEGSLVILVRPVSSRAEALA